ncbi:pyridoxine 5-phosphate synthase [Natronocella acetinitrilica]|uniref:Pyridoxine 5'-phosphate synthase n=1 Tax=Natronocella acetinitrilica TaxID=414046 RepID=A0AAE3G6E5_9GAMM|nr:pyridoxine 5'-phosphate synthase [Natronocella acetinitrilica]MCP1675899.1 pyridoxine 5-phosphate synthase [Natronocella acetinitrilica]
MSLSPQILLGINIDHVATLRQARGTRFPDPVEAALVAERAGADGITVHLREDRRHIQERDVELLLATVTTRVNLEMAVTDEMLALAEQWRPAHCCLVPERREELTTEGGLDVASQAQRMLEACSRLTRAGIVVSLFIDPDAEQIHAARECGAAYVELHTGAYAEAKNGGERARELFRLREAAALAASLDLGVNAGHGLDYHNVQPIAALPEMEELNIGFAIMARAMFSGLETAVRDMRHLMVEARR